MDDRIAKAPPSGIPLAVNSWTAPFWAGTAEHELLLPRCGACGRYRFPPTPFCPACRSQEIDWVAAPSEAFLYSYTIVERAIVPGTENSLPYVPAIVEFPSADNVRLITNLVAVRLDAIVVGKRVFSAWLDLPDGSIPIFTF
jgi:uncharacterized OB-fold protein